MRLWLKDSERRADPIPVRTDDRKAVLVGFALWLIALGGMLFFVTTLVANGHVWWLWTALVGLGLGLVLLVYTHRRRHRSR